MHLQIRQDKPGFCPICGSMALVPENETNSSSEKNHDGFLKTYQPLFVIVGLILLASVVAMLHNMGTWRDGMLNFMAGFFLVFSGLKLLDLPGFAEAYATYDLLARRVKVYGYVYPLFELLLGVAYLARFNLPVTNIATVILMLFSGLGVTINLMQGRRFQCACLGTMFKVPLTKVTLIEDFGMAAMALVMLLI